MTAFIGGLSRRFCRTRLDTLPYRLSRQLTPMSVLSYIADPRFSSVRWDLTNWYAHFAGIDYWEFIRQNIDRECIRSDIDSTKWDQFLNDVAAQYSTLRHPLDAIKAAIDGNSALYFLPGWPFRPNTTTLYRYMALDQFVKYNYKGGVMPGNVRTIKTLIDKGYITGADMEGTVWGKSIKGRDYAVWVSDGSLATESKGETVRDRVGLKHIAGGYLLEISYPSALLHERGMELYPPTAPDAFAEGADNWIWVKNRNAGGPDWGYTVDMTGGGAGAEGVPEALHAPFKIDPGDGARLALRVLDAFSKTPPQMDHYAMLNNGGI
jgi:hypothetical protein